MGFINNLFKRKHQKNNEENNNVVIHDVSGFIDKYNNLLQQDKYLARSEFVELKDTYLDYYKEYSVKSLAEYYFDNYDRLIETINPDNSINVSTYNQLEINNASNIQNLYAMGQQNEPAPAANTWQCACGATASGNFCQQCGSPKPTANGWRCSCGEQCGEGRRSDDPRMRIQEHTRHREDLQQR